MVVRDSVALEVKQLKKVYKGDLFKKPVHALKQIDCRFVEGTINLLLGHNGAGKTTTIKIILGLLKPTAGEVLYYGKPLTIEDKQSIGYMPEIHRLSPLLTPYETIKNHIRYYDESVLGGAKKKVIHDHLDLLGLNDHRKKKVRELSKGLRRRLAYILAVVHRPKMLILDEPFSGLDLAGRALIEGLLAGQREAGNTLIVASHDAHSSFKICDHFHVLKDGLTAFSSLTDEFTQQRDEYEIKVTGLESSHLTEMTQNFSSDLKDHHSEGYSHRLVVSGYDSSRKALSFFLDQGVVVQSFKPITEADQMVEWVSTKLMSEMPGQDQGSEKASHSVFDPHTTRLVEMSQTHSDESGESGENKPENQTVKHVENLDQKAS